MHDATAFFSVLLVMRTFAYTQAFEHKLQPQWWNTERCRHRCTAAEETCTSGVPCTDVERQTENMHGVWMIPAWGYKVEEVNNKTQ